MAKLPATYPALWLLMTIPGVCRTHSHRVTRLALVPPSDETRSADESRDGHLPSILEVVEKDLVHLLSGWPIQHDGE